MRARGKALHLSWLAVGSAALILGCSEDESLPPLNRPPPPSAAMASPQEVLGAYRVAYESRDSLVVRDLFDPAYVGTSTDLTDPPGSQVLTFHYADEVAHVAALRRTPSVTGVICQLGAPVSWTRLSSGDATHPDWAMIQLVGASIKVEINDGASFLQAGGPSETMSFQFSPTPDMTSVTDTVWKIVRWDEVRAAGP